jgi:hypothetical protein
VLSLNEIDPEVAKFDPAVQEVRPSGRTNERQKKTPLGAEASWVKQAAEKLSPSVILSEAKNLFFASLRMTSF